MCNLAVVAGCDARRATRRSASLYIKRNIKTHETNLMLCQIELEVYKLRDIVSRHITCVANGAHIGLTQNCSSKAAQAPWDGLLKS